MSIFVEIPIQGSVEEIWEKTQNPLLHQRWDLRFTRIEYLPKPSPSAPQEFLYETRLGFGITIRGKGESVGTRAGDHGETTSALRFWSDDARSLIREGSGYWKYFPTNKDRTQFLTAYDYRVRFGLIGEDFRSPHLQALDWMGNGMELRSPSTLDRDGDIARGFHAQYGHQRRRQVLRRSDLDLSRRRSKAPVSRSRRAEHDS